MPATSLDGQPPLVPSESPLTPLRFLERSADVWSQRPAVRAGTRTWTYSGHAERIGRLAAALRTELGVADGDRVAILAPNIAPMLELHYGVPGAGGVLVPLNTRLTGAEYAYILEHSGARVVVAATSLRAPLCEALSLLGPSQPGVVWADPSGSEGCEYEALVAAGQPSELALPGDERALLSINYTSGTTGRPKGVMTSHRGAYLHSLGVIAEAGLTPRSTYLWTLPMFHCNGWAYTWAVTATGAVHVCLPAVDPAVIWTALLEQGVTHLCAAPTVVTMLLASDRAAPCPAPIRLFVGGAPPAPALLERAAELRIEITHLYGLTETYGPFAVCAWNPDWDARPAGEQARLRARQGVATVVGEPLRVVDAAMRDVPRDGDTLGEVVMHGNNVMLGYYRDPESTETAFTGGWFHSGDLAVMHPDGYIELRDRLKDVVISGGENISTIEVEQALCAHPAIQEAAVVGGADEKWGEVPVAFVTLGGAPAPSLAELHEFLTGRIARFKMPKELVVIDELPKTGTGKIQKYILRQQMRDYSAHKQMRDYSAHQQTRDGSAAR
jgi:acyl-CoA synthetase (AMP-forming)/AMP-acid ligase II